MNLQKRPKKTRICLAIPGINYVSDSPRILSTLPIVPYLEEEFEVTVVFRKLLESPKINHKVATILDTDRLSPKEINNRQAYYHPHLLSAWKYRKRFQEFSQRNFLHYDLILEKEWIFLGSFSHAFARYRIPSITITMAEFKYKNDLPLLCKGNLVQNSLELLSQSITPQLRKSWLKNSHKIIAETEQMKSFLLEQGYANTEQQVCTISNGIDPEIFFPRDRAFCRQQLGISQTDYILVYVGSLNRYIQEPAPLIEALGREKLQNTILHVIGDGGKRKELEAIAQQYNSPVIFHGKLSQQEASLYIGASNLCVAPYNTSLFPENKFTCSSLKVPEYLACGRPVLTLPCERMNDLLDRGKYGYLVNNDVESYQDFLQKLLSLKETLNKEKSLIKDLKNQTLSKKRIVLTWREVAQQYSQVIWRTLSLPSLAVTQTVYPARY